MDKPEHIVSAKGRILPRRCDVEYVSFSAHADYQQTRSFIRQLAPDHVVLVHGADKEMKRMATRLRQMLANTRDGAAVRVDTPRNTHSVFFEFLQTKVAKVIGAMADECDVTTSRMLGSGRSTKRSKSSVSLASIPRGVAIHGVLVNQNFGHRIMSPADLKTYTELTVNSIQQKMHVPFWNQFALVEYFLGQVFSSVERQGASASKGKGKDVGEGNVEQVLVEGVVRVTRKMPDRVLLQWAASPTNDMIADACVAVIKSAESGPASVILTSKLCNHDSGSSGSSEAGQTLSLGERQAQIEMGLRNVLRNTYAELSVDLFEDKGSPDDEYDTRLDVQVDGVKAVVCCKLDGFGTVSIVGVENCEDEAVAETLLRVTTNVVRSMQLRTKV
jgi:cleavage and polyadenylation specificity factor subunit 3